MLRSLHRPEKRMTKSNFLILAIFGSLTAFGLPKVNAETNLKITLTDCFGDQSCENLIQYLGPDDAVVRPLDWGAPLNSSILIYKYHPEIPISEVFFLEFEGCDVKLLKNTKEFNSEKGNYVDKKSELYLSLTKTNCSTLNKLTGLDLNAVTRDSNIWLTHPVPTIVKLCNVIERRSACRTSYSGTGEYRIFNLLSAIENEAKYSEPNSK